MDGLPVEQIPNPSELTRLIDSIIRERLIIAIQRETQWVEVQEKKRLLEVRNRQDFWKGVRKWGGLVNNWTWAVLLILGSFSLGLFIGLNVLPEGVVCPSEYSPCYWLRLDERKSAY